MKIPKGPACSGCVFEHAGQWMVPDEMPGSARVCFTFQNPGKDEEEGHLVRAGSFTDVPAAPLLSKTGEMMEGKFFPLAAAVRGEVGLANAVRCRVNGGNELPPVRQTAAREAIAHCTRAYFKPPASVRVFVASGEHAMWMLTGEGVTTEERNLTGWRGWVLPLRLPGTPAEVTWADVYTPTPTDSRVLVTYHLAALFRQPSMRMAVQKDWSKIPAMLAGRWPAKPPDVTYVPPARLPAAYAFDTEFSPETRRVHRYSVAWRAGGEARVYSVPVASEGALPPPAHRMHPRIIMQNAPADIPAIQAVLGLPPGAYDLDDTMVAHAVLWADVGATGDDPDDASGRHNLNFVSSTYAPPIGWNRWKHLSGGNEALYAGLDAIGTYDLMTALRAELNADEGARYDYEECRLPHLHRIARLRSRGLRLDGERIKLARAELRGITEFEELRAQAVVGWPIELASNKQVGLELYRASGAIPPAQKGRRRG